MDCGNYNEMWDWKEEDYCLQKDANLGISPSLWDGVVQNENELSYMLDESTPLRACGDIASHVTDNGNVNKEMRQCRDASSQGKRRRMLQFDDEVLQNTLCDEEMSSIFLKSKERGDTLEDAMSDMTQWVSTFADGTSVSDYEGLVQPSDGWLADCFNDTEMHCSPDDMNLSGVSDVQTDNSESCYKPPEYEEPVTQVKHPPRTRRNVIFKGKKSYMKMPTKHASSIVYPFAFLKPCGAHGDVTLKDINQRILTPPPSKPKEDDDPTLYPTSAFSGKPVVGKTKIRTEGGKGSITIMRTKG